MSSILIVECETGELKSMYPTFPDRINDILMFDGFNTGSNSGFDLFVPDDIVVPSDARSFMIDLKIRCELKKQEGSGNRVHGYYLYPRSSISKTPLRQCNSVGIIDYEYRGTIKVFVDNVSSEPYSVRKGTRLFQLCMPDLQPFTVEYGAVNRETGRGEGGFGSTGK